MKADTICCYEAHGKKGIAESLHVQITRARLTVCEVGIFTTLENTPTPLLLKFIAHRRIFKRLPLTSAC